MTEIFAYKREISQKLSSGIESLFKTAKIDFLRGTALITAPDAVRVTDAEGGANDYTCDDILIATGSVPSRPPIPGLEFAMTSDELLEGCDHLYRSIVIIGGGVIGLELACAYAAFGTKITVVEALDHMLPMLDGDLTAIGVKHMKKMGMEFNLECPVQAVEASPVGAKVVCKNKAGETVTRYLQQTQSMFKTPWVYNNNFAMPDIEGLDQTIEDAFDPADLVYDPTVMCAVRNAGKWRRETVYEKQMSAKSLYTTINFPILRYADVLLMYAEAINEYAGAPDDQAKEAIREIRKRAGVKTNESLLGDYRSFRDLVRNERGRELAFEGLRKWDLIRWGTFVEKMHNAGTNQPTENKYRNVSYTNYASANYANVTARHIYLPIPTKELAVNHALRQNPLW